MNNHINELQSVDIALGSVITRAYEGLAGSGTNAWRRFLERPIGGHMGNLFRKIVHKRTGEAFELSYTQEANFVETLGLDGPKLMLRFTDPYGYLKDRLQVRELDELEVTLSDFFGADGIDEQLSFTILSCPESEQFISYNLIATPAFQLKQMADRTRIFRQRSIGDIIGALAPGLAKKTESFPVVENYHCIAGERPSALMRQYVTEQGAEAWIGRGTFNVKRFKTLMEAAPAFEYHHGKVDEQYTISSYSVHSAQAPLQEAYIRSYTGWNDDRGRIRSPLSGVLAQARKMPPVITQSQHMPTLGSSPIASRIAVDFLCQGNGFLTAGMTLKLWWHQVDPERPLNEALPDKVVIQAVAHYFVSQTYTCRVRGAVPLEAAY